MMLTLSISHRRVRLCLKTRFGFERLIFRLTASGSIDDNQYRLLQFPRHRSGQALPSEKPLALGPTTEFSDRAWSVEA